MTPKTVTTETLKQITHLAAALKAPRVTESAARLADHARDAGWTHEDYLAAVLEREVEACAPHPGPDGCVPAVLVGKPSASSVSRRRAYQIETVPAFALIQMAKVRSPCRLRPNLLAGDAAPLQARVLTAAWVAKISTPTMYLLANLLVNDTAH